jgi:signal peptide peptidase SppA
MSENTNPAGEDTRYPQVVRSVLETPWAILPRTLATIKDLVALRASGYRFTDEEIEARIGAKPARKDAQRAGDIAVIPVYGVITPKADLFTDMSGGTSIDRLRGAFLDAVEDDTVSAIVLDVDSPGGQVDLVPELAGEIRGARGAKPMFAVANTLAASAAYWIASQADEVFVTPSGEVGSIGVFAAHDDFSGALDKAGIKTTLISAGKFKTEANPFEPLSDDAREAIQARVDDAYRMFVHDVAKGRGVPVETIRSGFGEGRVMVARDALAEGMVDGIATLDEVVAKAARTRNPGTAATAAAEFAETYVAIYSEPQPGLTIVGRLEALRDNALELAELLPSLAEVKEGRLTKAKREPLAACPGALREAADVLDGVLAATNPHKERAVLDAINLGEIARRHELP